MLRCMEWKVLRRWRALPSDRLLTCPERSTRSPPAWMDLLWASNQAFILKVTGATFSFVYTSY